MESTIHSFREKKVQILLLLLYEMVLSKKKTVG